VKAKVFQCPGRSRFDVLKKRGRGASLKIAVPPSRKDEVCPSEDVSGEHHADDDLEQEDEFFESLEISGKEEGGVCGRGNDGLL